MHSGSVALITGAGQGLGKAFCRAVLQRGGKVAVVELNEKIGSAFVDECQAEFGSDSAHFIPCDVTNKSKFRNAFQQSVSNFGKIDIVCNNAGVSGLGNPHWQKVIDLNLTSVIEGTYLGIEHMSSKNGGNGGVIVNIASMAGLGPMPAMTASPSDGAAVYTATKHGVVGFSRCFKGILKDQGIRINCLCPIFVHTALVKNALQLRPETKRYIDKMGVVTAEEVANGFVQLIEDDTKDGAVLMVTPSDVYGTKYAFT